MPIKIVTAVVNNPMFIEIQFHTLKKYLKDGGDGGKFYCEIYDDVFLHYRAGGNWNKEGIGLHNALTEKLRDCFTEKMI